MKVCVHVPAKINLALDIVGKRQDGYHFVEMVMQSVGLYDTVFLQTNNIGGIKLNSNLNITDDIRKNTAYLAAEEFFKETNVDNLGIDINIQKRIPMQAGLAGGSADAAGVIIGLNKIFNTGLLNEDMFKMGAKVGADVPFCISGGTMLSKGIGTILEPIANFPDCYIVLSKPSIGISTKEAYEKSDNSDYVELIKVSEVVDSIYRGDLKEISSLIFNRFEHVMGIKEVESIKKIMNNLGALNSCMSGSGPTVFGIFEDKSKAEYCFCELKKLHNETYLCKPVGGPIIE